MPYDYGKLVQQHPGWDYLTASRAIHNNACFLYAIIATPDGTNPSYATVYDGNNTTGDIVARIKCTKATTNHIVFDPPLQLNRGCHIEFESNLESCTVLTVATTSFSKKPGCINYDGKDRS